jgi:trk system potassium uptake protein TrkA
VYIIIGGGGKVGYHLALELLQGNHEVLIIERDGARASAIAEELGDIVVAGDACEATVLDAAGVARAELVAAVTGDDEDNLVICEVARRRGVPRTIARINNPRTSCCSRGGVSKPPSRRRRRCSPRSSRTADGAGDPASPAP